MQTLIENKKLVELHCGAEVWVLYVRLCLLRCTHMKWVD